MDEYLMKYGFSPLDTGVDRYLETMSAKSKKTSEYEEGKLKKATNKSETENCSENKFSDVKLKKLPLTMAYIPMQCYKEAYGYEEALKNGTLFPELDKPFLGRKP